MTIIRHAVPAEIAAVETIAREAYEPYVERIGRAPAPLTEDYAPLVRRGAIEVAEDAQGVCGFLVVLLGERALLDNVAVATRVRGQGVGRILIEHAEIAARQAGYRSIELYTNEAMTENLTLYPRLGYRETRRVTEKGLNRIYFCKPLDPAPEATRG